MIEGMDYIVRYVSLPMHVHGMTVMDENGFYNVYINSDQSDEIQRAAYDHELKHLERDDFSRSDTPIEIVEAV